MSQGVRSEITTHREQFKMEYRVYESELGIYYMRKCCWSMNIYTALRVDWYKGDG